jgi:activating signal cointegrator complex subunit 3
VVIKGTEYFDAKTCTYVDFPVTDILQMMGRYKEISFLFITIDFYSLLFRAGRPQFDDSAVACIFVQESKKNFYRKFLHEPFPVESSLHQQLTEHLNAEIGNYTIQNYQDCVEYLTWTYFFRRLIMNPSYYQCEENTSEGIQKYLMKLIQENIENLVNHQCITVEKIVTPGSGRGKVEEGNFKTNYLGLICSYYYLNHKTPLMIEKALTQLHLLLTTSSQGEQKNHSSEEFMLNSLLMILSNCLEYSEIPVRHNEENLNLQLAQELKLVGNSPYDPPSLLPAESLAFKPIGSMSSPHTKVYLLFHAYLKKAKLPITDYLNDTKMVFDQSNRIMNAMIDIAGEKNYLMIVYYLIYLLQLLHRVSYLFSCFAVILFKRFIS